MIVDRGALQGATLAAGKTSAMRVVGLKTVAQIMRRDVITVGPDATVGEAVEAMRRHRIGGLPVVKDGAVVGMVTTRDLLGQPVYRAIADVMTHDVATITPDEPITAAYSLMDRRGIGRLAVVEGDRLLGLITRQDTLHELGKLTDPLTDLPWSGTLRQRAADLLMRRAEIVILFIDLDRFRLVNKRFGHVVGDQVIVAVARRLQQYTDPQHDLLCRYGGDEFAVVTTRTAEEAERMAAQMLQAIHEESIAELGEVRLTAAIGIAGGRRTEERTDVHPSATVDDLISLASRASTEAKQRERPILHAHEMRGLRVLETIEDETRVRLATVQLNVGSTGISALVELSHDGRRFKGEAEGSAQGEGPHRALAQATLTALANLMPSGWTMELQEVAFVSMSFGEAVTVAVALAGPDGEEFLLGTAAYDRNRVDAPVRATLKAVNRRLPWLIAQRG